MRIQWAPRALEQAETAFDYIAEDRPHAAEGWLAGLFARVELLLPFPYQGREVPEARRDDLREMIYEERHRIVYRVDADWIRILLVHPSPIPMSAEDLETLGVAAVRQGIAAARVTRLVESRNRQAREQRSTELALVPAD